MRKSEVGTLLVIVGAGASFDCLPWHPGLDSMVTCNGLGPHRFRDVRPPLTKDLAESQDLHNDLLNLYPDATPAVDYLRRELARGDAGAPTLERALQQFQESGATDDNVAQHVKSVQFYLRDLLWATTQYVLRSPQIGGGATNYTGLVRDLYRWACDEDTDVVFVSFNYDLLLEDACQRHFGFDPWSMDGYLANPRMRILKPHGSVQWQRRFSDLTPTSSRRRADEKAIRCHSQPDPAVEIDPIDKTESGSLGPIFTPGIPALALPIADKCDFIWPKSHANVMESLQGEVSRVLTIGWRGAERHFLDLLRPIVRSNSRWAVVTGGADTAQAQKDANQVVESLIEHTSRSGQTCSPFFEGFNEYLNQGQLAWLLKPLAA